MTTRGLQEHRFLQLPAGEVEDRIVAPLGHDLLPTWRASKAPAVGFTNRIRVGTNSLRAAVSVRTPWIRFEYQRWSR